MKLGEIYGKLVSELQYDIQLNDALPIINRCYEEIAIFSRSIGKTVSMFGLFPGVEHNLPSITEGGKLYIPFDVGFGVWDEYNGTNFIKRWPLIYFKDYNMFKLLNVSYPSFSVNLADKPNKIIIKGVNIANYERSYTQVYFFVKPPKDALVGFEDETIFSEHLNDVFYHYLVVNVADIIVAKEKDPNRIEIIKSIQSSHLVYLLNEEYLKPYIQIKLGGK